MSLQSLTYTEFQDKPQHWQLEKCDFAAINLVVGRNSTGKTRLINVISGLCKVLNGRHTVAFMSGTYVAEIFLAGKTYSLHLEFAQSKVVKEELFVDGVRRLHRDQDGNGAIYYELEGKDIGFQVPPTVIAIQQRQDALQHPFIVELSKWALGCKTYLFAASREKDTYITLTNLQTMLSKEETNSESEDLVLAYTKAFKEYGEAFDTAVLRDMSSLGYELDEVGTGDIRQLNAGINLPEPLIGVFVTERDRGEKLSQGSMSQGMYRALALIIHINIATFSHQRTLFLVDDIGEGLDFERSVNLIDVLISHAKPTGLQVIMTSNDRFVMNRIPLEHWTLLRRTRSTIRAFNQRNSPKEFEDFKFMGLSNFDFFTSAAFQ